MTDKQNIDELFEDHSGYSRVLCSYFLNMKSVPCDVYIRVNKISNYEYIKRIHQHEVFDNADIERYMESGLDHFYVPDDQKDEILKYLGTKLCDILEHKDLDLKDQIRSAQIGHDLALSLLSKNGFELPTSTLIESTIHAINKISNKESKLLSLLSHALKTPTSFLVLHSTIVALIACRIIDELDWGSPQHKKIVTLAALLHDITLKDDKLVKINSYKEFVGYSLTKEEEALVMNHAKDACALVMEYPALPFGAESIILHHHGEKTGVSFGHINPGKIEPLTIVLMIAEEFAIALLKAVEEKKTFDARAVWEQLYKDHPYQHVTNIINAMKSAFSN